MGASTAEYLELLKRSHLFKTVDKAGQEELIRLARVIEVDTGEPIIQEGSEGDCFFLMLKGMVTVQSERYDRMIMLAELGRGAVIGEVSLLTGEPRTATVIAKEPSVLLRFAEPEVNSLLDRNPKIKELLVRVLVHRAKDTIEKLSRDLEVS